MGFVTSTNPSRSLCTLTKSSWFPKRLKIACNFSPLYSFCISWMANDKRHTAVAVFLSNCLNFNCTGSILFWNYYIFPIAVMFVTLSQVPRPISFTLLTIECSVVPPFFYSFSSSYYFSFLNERGALFCRQHCSLLSSWNFIFFELILAICMWDSQLNKATYTPRVIIYVRHSKPV